MPFLLIGLGLALLLGALGYALWSDATANPGVAPLPASVVGLPQVSAVTGPAAVRDINRLHENRFPLSSGAVARYGNRGEVTLWVAGAPMTLVARRMVAVMEERISEGNSPFRPLATREVGGRQVFELEGMGQKHFYFRSKALVIWLAANRDIAEDTLNDVLEFYP